jgi:hypothetical protein
MQQVKLKELHEDRSSSTPICRVVEMEHEDGRTTKGMGWPAPGVEPVVKPLYWMTKAQPRQPRNAGQERRKQKPGRESGCGGQMDHVQMTAEWEQQHSTSTIMNGGPAAVIWALEVWNSLMPSGGRLDSHSW